MSHQRQKDLSGKGPNGFLLIEVVFAVAIVATCVVMVLSTFFNVRRAVRSTEDHVYAGILLKAQMDDLEQQAFITTKKIDTGFESGDFNEVEGFSWKKTQAEGLGGNSELGKFELIVSWDDDSKINATTYLKIK